MKSKLCTLTLYVDQSRILLGLKKRGLGVGRWNGFGGKVNMGESIEAAAQRETLEECGITITAMELAGIHEFSFSTRPDEVLEVHVFRILSFTGEPIETEEMKPGWFPVEGIPYSQMWADDRSWLPLFLGRQLFRTRIHFDKSDQVLTHDIRIVTSLG